ncbi:hypothetical protein, conserved [Leishmania donovani]|uniref:Uncharacterized protein n=1 Tax=Leishmania donovani TaxID=5661 RepID=A0A3Q8IKL3_LEIDO|nr:hypothetical protein, conserved [Leishmania donovani]AYU78383.1 hypothetical protein LdCL_200015100 [Leishmania donovani]TPP49899.1 hypothetical protein CGC21_29325 [Leishmania donovani]CBZ33739.1 hypothetical protein, conserved [Leishmania donovani]
MNTSEAALLEPLVAARRTGGVGGSDAPVSGVDGNGDSQQHIGYSTKNLSKSNAHPLPRLQPPTNGEWRGMPSSLYTNLHPCSGGRPMISEQRTPLMSVNDLYNAPPHMIGGFNGSGNGGPPIMRPPLPPPAFNSSASSRPAPPSMHSCGPQPPVSLKKSLRTNGPVKQIAICGSSEPGNTRLPSSQLLQSQRVMSVARGPQPSSVEPTRLANGKKIKTDKQRPQVAEAKPEHYAFTGPTKSAMKIRKAQLQQQRRGANLGKEIKTTVGNDNSWMKGLTYSTWVDSPKGPLHKLDHEGPYKRRPKTKNNSNKNRGRKTRSNMGKTSLLLEALRNLFR